MSFKWILFLGPAGRGVEIGRVRVRRAYIKNYDGLEISYI